MRRRVLRNFGPVLLADDAHPLKAAASNFAGCSADELIAHPEDLLSGNKRWVVVGIGIRLYMWSVLHGIRKAVLRSGCHENALAT